MTTTNETQATNVEQPAKAAGWSPEEEKVIAMYQETAGVNRSAAIKRMRRLTLKGMTAAQILEAGPGPRSGANVEPKAEEPKAEPKPKAKATPKPKAKKAAKPATKREHRLTYDEARKQGICVDCRKRAAKADRSQCQHCIDATRERAEKRAAKRATADKQRARFNAAKK